ncbi:MAG: S1 RNA-binding domain-containing protein [Defluviitaleaceae bacterium]|nr:S1 RNA-binding domain-containing protein [Defluviitaleaceae bacterium]
MAESAVTVGNIYTGTVLKIKPFGAIVSLPGGVPGLVHISQITNGYVQNVADVLNVGDEVDVRVVSYEEASGKISLSMKDVPQSSHYGGYDDEEDEEGEHNYRYDAPPVITAAQAASFEEKFKSWQKISNERIAGINRRNKRR